MIFSLVMGALVPIYGYTPFFIAHGVLVLIAAMILWTLVRKPGSAPTRESGIIPILLGGGAAGYIGLVAGIDKAGIAGYVGVGFAALLFVLGIVIEIRARTQKAAAT